MNSFFNTLENMYYFCNPNYKGKSNTNNKFLKLKMMKKVFFVMAVAGMFGFAACNNNQATEETVDTVAIENVVEETVEEVVDSTVATVENAVEEVVAE